MKYENPDPQKRKWFNDFTWLLQALARVAPVMMIMMMMIMIVHVMHDEVIFDSETFDNSSILSVVRQGFFFVIVLLRRMLDPVYKLEVTQVIQTMQVIQTEQVIQMMQMMQVIQMMQMIQTEHS